MTPGQAPIADPKNDTPSEEEVVETTPAEESEEAAV